MDRANDLKDKILCRLIGFGQNLRAFPHYNINLKHLDRVKEMGMQSYRQGWKVRRALGKNQPEIHVKEHPQRPSSQNFTVGSTVVGKSKSCRNPYDRSEMNLFVCIAVAF